MEKSFLAAGRIIRLSIWDTGSNSRACCIFDEKKSKLYGFYVGEIEKKELHHRMSSSLPPFMVPGALRKVEQMPLTKNGKTDRKALMEKHAKGARA